MTNTRCPGAVRLVAALVFCCMTNCGKTDAPPETAPDRPGPALKTPQPDAAGSGAGAPRGRNESDAALAAADKILQVPDGSYRLDSPEWKAARDIALRWCGDSAPEQRCPESVVNGLKSPVPCSYNVGLHVPMGGPDTALLTDKPCKEEGVRVWFRRGPQGWTPYRAYDRLTTFYLPGPDPSGSGAPPDGILRVPDGEYGLDSPEWKAARDTVLHWCGVPGIESRCSNAVVKGLKGAEPWSDGKCNARLHVPTQDRNRALLTDWECNGGARAWFRKGPEGWVLERAEYEEGGD